MKMARMKVADLKPHPKNEEIYGYNEDVSDLVDKIGRSNNVHTLVVNTDNYILAGHRRRKACMQLGIKEVDVEIRSFDSPEEELEFIIDNNSTREKTIEQKAREAKALKEVESILANRRQAILNGKNKLTPVSAEASNIQSKGESRNIVAKKVGLKSGHEVDRSIKAINTIDELTEKGRTEDAELIRCVLNNGSVSTAEELARNIDIVVIPEEEKALVKSGKKSPYSYVEQAKQKTKPKPETKICSVCEKELPIAEFSPKQGICKNCRTIQDRERRSGIFKDCMGNRIEYDKSLVNSEAMLAAIADVKEEKNLEKGIDYDMQFQFFQVSMNDYFFENKKFIDGEIFKEMPFEIKEKFKEEVERLSDFMKVLKVNLN